MVQVDPTLPLGDGLVQRGQVGELLVDQAGDDLSSLSNSSCFMACWLGDEASAATQLLTMRRESSTAAQWFFLRVNSANLAYSIAQIIPDSL